MDGRSDIKSTPAKLCETCGATFRRKRFTSGTLEDFGCYLKRRFCSLSCANSQSKGGNSRSRSHVRARQHVGLFCEVCGSTENLVVHHVDENWSNNDPLNLQTLCATCHKSWHASQRAHGTGS